MYPALKRGMLLEDSSPSAAVLYRVAEVDRDNSAIFLLGVHEGYPTGTSLPIEQNLEVVESQLGSILHIVPECIRHRDMVKDPKELSAAALKVWHRRLKQVGNGEDGLFSERNWLSLMRKETRGPLFKDWSRRHHVADSGLRLLFTRYIWYGCRPSALIGLTSERGGPGKERAAGKAKRGRPSAFAVEDSNSPDRGINITEWHKRKFRLALHLWWVGCNYTLRKTFNKMIQRLYVFQTRTPRGYKVGPIDSRKCPTYEQFCYWARKIIAKEGLRRGKIGKEEWADVHSRSYGSSSDLALMPGDIYDMDGTGGKGELVDSKTHKDRIGRPTLVLAVDRASDYIVGAFLSMHSEKWDLFRRCFFSAAVSKKEMLEDLGLAPELWPYSALPFAVFVDQGPGSSKRARQAWVDELHLDRAVAPAKTPQAKGLAEGINNKVHSEMAEEAGGYTRDKKGKRMAQRRKSARNDAAYSPSEWFKKTVKAIAVHNKTTNVTHLLTVRMRRDHVRPVPEEIFRWGLENRRGGEVSEITDAQLYVALLDKEKDVTVHAKGVCHKNAYFLSQALEVWRENQMLEHCHERHFSPKIDVLKDPVDPLVRYWEWPAGEMDRLTIHEQGELRFEGMIAEEVDYNFTLEDQKNAILIARENARRSFLNREQTEVLGDISENKKALPPSAKPVTLAKREEQRREAALEAAKSRSLMDKESGTTPDDETNEEVNSEEDVPAPSDGLIREGRFADMFSQTFGKNLR